MFDVETIDLRLLVFAYLPHPDYPLREAISEQLASLAADQQINGDKHTISAEQFNIGQLLHTGFRFSAGTNLWGWSDYNELRRVPAWPADGSLPLVLTDTLQAWMHEGYCDIEYGPETPAVVVTVRVPFSPQPWGRCRCGHAAIDHQIWCTQLITAQLGCGCLTWRPMY